MKNGNKINARLFVFASFSLLTACANDVDPSRLNTLLGSGLDAQTDAKIGAQLEKALSQGKTADQRKSAFQGVTNSAGAQTSGALVQAALARNARIGAAADGISLAEAERLNAVFGYLPQVTLSYDKSNVNQRVLSSDNAVFAKGAAKYPVKVLSVQVEQPLLDLSRIFAISYAKNARSKAEVEYIGTVRDVVYEVLDAYVTAAQSKARAQTLRQRVALIDRQINAQSNLTGAGLGNRAEPEALRSERASLASDEALEAARYAETLGQLALLTGTNVTGVAGLQLPAGVLGAERRQSADSLVTRGLQENPKVMAAALAVVGADIERKRAMSSDFSPVLSAYATLDQETRAGSRFGGGSKTRDRVVGLHLSIPLFNAGGAGYALPTSTIRLKQEALNYYALQRQIETEIRATHARLGQLSKAIGQAGTAARTAASAASNERDRLAAGESIDLAVSAREVRVSQATERRAFYQAEYMRSWLRLQYLAGADLRKGL